MEGVSSRRATAEIGVHPRVAESVSYTHLDVYKRQIRGRLAQRCDLLEEAQLHRDEAVALEEAPLRYILYRPVQSPGSLREVSISTKQCFAEAFQRGVPIFFQSGVIVPRENILSQRYTQASTDVYKRQQ